MLSVVVYFHSVVIFTLRHPGVESNDTANSKGRSLAGLSIQLTDIKLYAAFVTPQEPIKPPSTQFLALNDLHISSQAHTSNGSATLSYTIPASTHKIFVCSQHLNLSDNTATGATGFVGCLNNATAPPSVDYAGTQVPARVYTNSLIDLHRAYLDLYAGALLASGQSTYDSLEEWNANKLYLHNFPRLPTTLAPMLWSVLMPTVPVLIVTFSLERCTTL